ncbi:MAG: hypothetical protein KGJ13_13070, partial [Patescibacteria group bacterium]|nr:hypothetical protein [Patescibacteria group bacterium]
HHRGGDMILDDIELIKMEVVCNKPVVELVYRHREGDTCMEDIRQFVPAAIAEIRKLRKALEHIKRTSHPDIDSGKIAREALQEEGK